jgi:aspartyl-tRNA(Asn)/glutamyl-tRNA(Gln) amidotransferase subunit C
MADFDKQSLDHLKKLCRIECDEGEDADILKSLKRILEYVEQMNEVATDDAKPCNYVLNGMGKNRWREDTPALPLNRDTFLANAPDQIAGMIRVPPILKQ